MTTSCLSSSHRTPSHLARSLCAGLLLLPLACSDSSSTSAAPSQPIPSREAGRPYRAIAGISMGGYGALNLGTKRREWFGQIAALGGPVDLRQLVLQIVEDNLEVKEQAGIPTQVGEDFTFDHQAPYPGRDVRLSMIKDLVLCFGNPVLHHDDPMQAMLAIDSQPAQLLRDDQFDNFNLAMDPRGFLDGGDPNDDGVRQMGEAPTTYTDVLLVAKDTLAAIAPSAPTSAIVVLGDRAVVDVDQNGVYDVGHGIIVNLSEPFVDADGDGWYTSGESFDDFGLDGVDGTGDFGEGNGTFDEDPDLATWRQQDPTSRLRDADSQDLADQRLYMDVGTTDAFEFESHYDAIVAAFANKGLTVEDRSGLQGSCSSVPSYPNDHVLVRYDGGHIGIPEADDINDALTTGDFCGSALVWNRFLDMLGFLDSGFADGDYGTGGSRPLGETTIHNIPSPALTPTGAATVEREVAIYLPPAWFNTSGNLPVVYFLGGYGQEPGDYERFGLLMDLLIATDEVQNMVLVFLPGSGGFKGSFYVDHKLGDQIPAALAGEVADTTGMFETSLLQDLIPAVEDDILQGRVKHTQQ